MSFKISSIDSLPQSQELSYWWGDVSGVQNLIKKVCSAVSSPFVGLYNWICPVNSVTGYREIRLIPTAAETAMGAQIYSAACELKGGILDDEKMQKRAKDVLAKIAPHAQRPGREFEYEIRILNSDEVNAWAAPGGKLGFNKGLIDEIDKMDLSEWEGLTPDDILAAALGHEISHAAIGHVRKKVEKTLLFLLRKKIEKTLLFLLHKKLEKNPRLLLVFLTVNIAAQSILFLKKSIDSGNLEMKELIFRFLKIKNRLERYQGGDPFSLQMTLSRFYCFAYELYKLMDSRNAEYEADLYGTRLSFEGGYDVRGSLALQKLFSKVYGSNSNQIPSYTHWLFNHPDPVKRLKENQKTVDAIFKEHGCYKKADSL